LFQKVKDDAIQERPLLNKL